MLLTTFSAVALLFGKGTWPKKYHCSSVVENLWDNQLTYVNLENCCKMVLCVQMNVIHCQLQVKLTFFTFVL